MVQGSRQETVCITSEQRTEPLWKVGCAGSARYRAFECRLHRRNKSGTAEDSTPLSLIAGDKGVFLF